MEEAYSSPTYAYVMNSQQFAAVSVYRKNRILQELGRLESVSGVGSSAKAATQAVTFISEIIRKHNMLSLSDCPCGDFHWMRDVELSEVSYHGYDIVEELVEENQKKYPHMLFTVFDAIHQILPQTDIIICRDFLFHLHFADGLKVLKNFFASGSKYLITTSFNELVANVDLSKDNIYGFRKINVMKEPYNLGTPIESCLEFQDRFLNLYELR